MTADRQAAFVEPAAPVHVVGVDPVRGDATAARFAATLARARGAQLVLAAVRRPGAAGTGRGAPDEEALEARFADLRAELAPAPCRTLVVEATTAAMGLQRVATAERAELIVVGASRRDDGEIGREGVGERLLHGSPCAVAVVPRRDERRDMSERLPVGCAFDGGADARRALEVAGATAAALGLPLRVIGVVDRVRPGSTRPELRCTATAVELLRREGSRVGGDLAVEVEVLEGHPGEQLAAATRRLELLVCGNHGYGPVGALLEESVTHLLARRADCPLLAVERAIPAPGPDGGRPRSLPPREPGVPTAHDVALLVDQYELTMAASYLRRSMDEPAVFELAVRRLPRGRGWLVAAGLGPALQLVESLRFDRQELDFLRSQGYGRTLLGYLERFRFGGDVDAVPEGTVVFAGEPLVRVTAPLVEAQILETLLLNQVDFQTALATKAARIALAAGGGRPDGARRVLDFSARRDHGVDAAMKAARCAAIVGIGATSNLAAARRYGLRPAGTMAHSYVLAFADEYAAFRAFLQDNPDRPVLLVDTYDTLEGVRTAIRAARDTGIALGGVRLDSGDLGALARAARAQLDAAGMPEARIVASGDLDEWRIAALVADGAPIDLWGVGTQLGTSHDAPSAGAVYKLVARRVGGAWCPVAKTSPGKATVGWAKQIYRVLGDGGVMDHDVVVRADEPARAGTPLLVPAVRSGRRVDPPSLAEMQALAWRSLAALPAPLRSLDPTEPYPVRWSPGLRAVPGPDGGANGIAFGEAGAR